MILKIENPCPGNNFSTVSDIALKFCVYVSCVKRKFGIAFVVTEVTVKVTVTKKICVQAVTVWYIALKFGAYVPCREEEVSYCFWNSPRSRSSPLLLKTAS